ncbi:MAG: glycosyltransferase [bacterium]|nr:glycosyltransferase [bacterium]
MKQINILQIISSKDATGGSQEHTRILCAGLDKTKYRIIVVTRPGSIVPYYKEQGFEVIPVELRHNPGSILKLLGIIKRYKIHIIHTHNMLADRRGCVAGWLGGVPIVVTTIHTLMNTDRFGEEKRGTSVWQYNFLLKHVPKRIIALSKEVKYHTQKELNLEEDRISLIYNASDLSRLNLSVNKQEKKREFGIDENCCVVGTVGRLVELKGYPYLIKAASLILQKFPKKLKFLIVGDGYMAEKLKTLAKGLGIADKIIFAGQRQDVPEILHILDIFVLTSYYEGLPRSIIEAQACGVPVVATNVGGTPEVVINDKTGILVPTKDEKAIAKAVIDLLTNKDNARRMGNAGREWVQKQFDAPVFIKRTEYLFEDLIRKHIPDVA